MIDSDGAVLVADASFPRLLRFTSEGELLGDVDSQVLARRPDESSVALDALGELCRTYGRCPPRFLPGVLAGLAALSRNGLRYPIPPYGIQSDAGAGLAVSYSDKSKSS